MMGYVITRPDQITRSGIIQPFAPHPISMAQDVPDNFMTNVRGQNPAVVTPPTPQDIVSAAAAVAGEFRKGNGAIVKLGKQPVKVYANRRPKTGIVSAVWAAAHSLLAGKAALVKVGPQTALATPGAGWQAPARQAVVSAGQAITETK